MVAAVKLSKVRTQAENSRPYVCNMETMMRALCSSAKEIKHPLLTAREGVAKIILVVITSDRGLCGTFNANVVNAAKNFIDEHPDQEISIISIGRKGQVALSRMGYAVEKFYSVPWGDAIGQEVKTLNTYLIDAFEKERADAVYLLYSRFANVLKYEPITIQHLPIPQLTEEEQKKLVKWAFDFIVEPDFYEVAEKMVPRYMESQLYHSLIESLASEHAARMVSMRNANDNAGEVIQDLTLSYNKARQSSITSEILDIIGGVEALKG